MVISVILLSVQIVQNLEKIFFLLSVILYPIKSTHVCAFSTVSYQTYSPSKEPIKKLTIPIAHELQYRPGRCRLRWTW